MNNRELRAYLGKIGSQGGRKEAQRMTKQQRIERARKAARAAKEGGTQ